MPDTALENHQHPHPFRGLDQTIAGLRNEGIEVKEPFATPVCKISFFTDLEGNEVTLHQITVPH